MPGPARCLPQQSYMILHVMAAMRYIDFLKDQLAWWDKEYMKIRESRILLCTGISQL